MLGAFMCAMYPIGIPALFIAILCYHYEYLYCDLNDLEERRAKLEVEYQTCLADLRDNSQDRRTKISRCDELLDTTIHSIMKVKSFSQGGLENAQKHREERRDEVERAKQEIEDRIYQHKKVRAKYGFIFTRCSPHSGLQPICNAVPCFT